MPQEDLRASVGRAYSLSKQGKLMEGETGKHGAEKELEGAGSQVEEGT